ncbi:MAG: PH domain-containing protein [Hamadaea sp.]|uniref:PH domain-containing protein n=1 Tax=Hamadaea sp. TaxID=2024425 RepID=UPI00185EA12E|nr:PH domain-containing protein [Hamadaea sp.]NUR72933.1 PH domain-containing protein [Hamadaea sp.]NUT23581.1 PH domain-containing protein [Hamadaea sp.]
MTQPVADALQPWPDTVDWHPVSPRLATLQRVEVLLGLLVPVAAAVAVYLIWDWIWALLIGGVFVVAALVRIVLIGRSVRSWGYAERDDDLLVRHGRIVRHLSIVPYARMQFVDVSAGPLERLFGLATVQLHTAAAASDARVPGLVPAEAARLRDRLTALGEIRTEGL